MQAKTVQIEHLGIVSQVIEEVGLVESIDRLIPLPNATVSMGQRVASMVLNALGFVNHPLYLSENFFDKRPVELLLGNNVKVENLNDDCLGIALDKINEYGETQLFSKLALNIINNLGQLGPNFKLDSTSFSLTGQYKADGAKKDTTGDHDTSAPQIVAVDYGHSKDHRPDLKQVMMALVTTGPSDFPIMMMPQSGNTSDRSEFAKIVQAQAKKLQKEFTIPDMLWAADSALYNKNWVRSQKELGILWVTRAPDSLKMSRNGIQQMLSTPKSEWILGSNGYHLFNSTGDHGGDQQRLVVVFSEQAHKKQVMTFDRNLMKRYLVLSKAVEKLGREEFKCEADAIKALKKIMAKEVDFEIASYEINPIERYQGKGRPRKDAEPKIVGYRIDAHLASALQVIRGKRAQKGMFVLVSNATDTDQHSAMDVLSAYKGLSGTERAFKFLKDPLFMASQFYLNKTTRITALMCVMTISLMIYTIVQHKVRHACEAENESIENLAGKPVKKPSTRNIFQHFSGISIVRLLDPSGGLISEVFESLNAIQQKILRLLGPPYEAIYRC